VASFYRAQKRKAMSQRLVPSSNAWAIKISVPLNAGLSHDFIPICDSMQKKKKLFETSIFFSVTTVRSSLKQFEKSTEACPRVMEMGVR